MNSISKAADVIPVSLMTQNKLDRFLSRVSHVSQLGLLILALFGYFYTVLPIYQKSLLDEEIAKKTIELNEKTKEVGLRRNEIEKQKQEIANIEKAYLAARARLNKSQSEISVLRKDNTNKYEVIKSRLLDDFVILGKTYCPFNDNEKLKISFCLTNVILNSSNMDPLSDADKGKLVKLVDEMAPSAISGIEEITRNTFVKKADLDRKKEKVQSDCGADIKSQQRSGKDLKTIYECNSAKINLTFDEISIKSDEQGQFDKLSLRLLGGVKDKFLSSK